MKAILEALIRSLAAGLMASLLWFVVVVIVSGIGPNPHTTVSQVTAAVGGMLASALCGMIVTWGCAPRQLHIVPIIIGWLLAIPLSPVVSVPCSMPSSEALILCSLFVAAGTASTYALRFPKARA